MRSIIGIIVLSFFLAGCASMGPPSRLVSPATAANKPVPQKVAVKKKTKEAALVPAPLEPKNATTKKVDKKSDKKRWNFWPFR